MKKLFAFSLIALAALAVSCNKNEVQAPVNDGPKMRTVTCTIATPDTKVSINPTNGKTKWEAGDEILFRGKYGSGKYCAVLTLSNDDISEDGKTFTATIPEFVNGADQAKWEDDKGYSSNMFAIYPASAAYPDGEGAHNWYGENIFAETNLPLMSGFNDGYDSSVFTFYNLCGILSFTVTGDYDSYVLSGNNGETVGYDTYVSRIYKKKDGSMKTDWIYTSDSYFPVTGLNTVSGTVTPGQETKICIPNGVTFTDGFTIMFFKNNLPKKTLTKSGAIEVARNAYRPMGNIESQLVDYVAPTSHPSSIAFTDDDALDVSGTANCYVVPVTTDGGGKVYTFKAYKGNSTSDVGTIASVSILWETYNNAEEVTKNSVIADVDFDKQDANLFYTMVFKMPATLHAGNALIAAKDAGGNILWSWHIWVPANEISLISEAQYSTKNTMSRNLGALVDTPADAAAPVESFGLLYEWGRKDPFPGLGVTSGKGAATVAGTAITFQSERMTIEEAIQNPTVYVNVSEKAWTPEETATEADGVLWGETTKTIYDPCPLGYMLPQRLSTDFWKGTNMATLTEGFSYSADNGSFVVGSLVFPLAGYMDDGGEAQKKAGIRSLLWSGRWDSTTENGYGFYANLENSDGPSFKRSSVCRSRGGSIRCVAE